MLEHRGDKAKIIHFSCDLRKRRSEGLTDNFTWRELEVSGKRKFSGLVSHIEMQLERRSGSEFTGTLLIITIARKK